MGRVDRIRVVSSFACESVVPLCSDAGTSGDWDHSLGNRLIVWVDASIANDIVGGDVGNGLVHISANAMLN